MKRNSSKDLNLGPNVIEILIPHRRPFLMVDVIRSFAMEPRPMLESSRHITVNEPCFAGHFPGLYIWPGVYTIEGLGQSGALLITLMAVWRAAREEGVGMSDLAEALRNLDRGFRLQPGHEPEAAREFMRRINQAHTHLAVGTSVEMKFTRPVFAGQRLDYRVELTGHHGDGVRFEAEASVEGVPVAVGHLRGAAVVRPHPPGFDPGS